MKIILSYLKAVLLVVAVIVLIFSSCQLYSYNKERMENEKLAKEMVAESRDLQTMPVSVDFDKLRQENNDIIAWLYQEGTPINYPIVQAEDNSYYLRRGIDGKYRLSGTLFADYLNKGDFTDNNTIIFGHNMKNDTMFGSLTEYRNQKYYNEHPEMYLLTPEEEYKIKMIAGVTVDSRASIYKLPLEDKYKENFISKLLKESSFEAEYKFSSNDRFIMLSTCSYVYNNARYVLIGVLEEL